MNTKPPEFPAFFLPSETLRTSAQDGRAAGHRVTISNMPSAKASQSVDSSCWKVEPA